MRLWPAALIEDRPPPNLSQQRVLIIDTGSRLRVYADTKPDPTCVLDEPYEDRALHPAYGQRGASHRYWLEDGRQILIARGGGCKCGRMTSWEPSS